MNRKKLIQQLVNTPQFDVIVIGGGATGLGCAVDSASRGFKTLLIEKDDFAKATSSRSTKLIHGGLRYLQQGNISLVTEALKERGRLCQNAPHLISHRPFLVPNYKWWEGPFYGFGLKIYDALAGDLGIEKSYHISKEKTLEFLPNLKQADLRGGVIYYDGQFDDARLAITLVKTCYDLGGIALNYIECEGFLKENDHISGVLMRDRESKDVYKIKAKCVINACGIFSDQLRKLDSPKSLNHLFLSQGVHLVLKGELLSSNHAILVPHTEDHRVLFLVPWHGRVLAGTTDTHVKEPLSEPKPTQTEVNFIIQEAEKYLKAPLKSSDILSVFAGLRPLAKEKETTTAKIARNHVILVSSSRLISIIGGKWTTYRKMGEDVIDRAIRECRLKDVPSQTASLKLHGAVHGMDPDEWLSCYGSDFALLQELHKEDATYSELLHPKLPYQKSEVIWATRYEMARKCEDILARRTRALLLDAKSALEASELTCKLMAKELGYGQSWVDRELKDFHHLAQSYLPNQYLNEK